jgi:hypothetical protein
MIGGDRNIRSAMINKRWSVIEQGIPQSIIAPQSIIDH